MHSTSQSMMSSLGASSQASIVDSTGSSPGQDIPNLDSSSSQNEGEVTTKEPLEQGNEDAKEDEEGGVVLQPRSSSGSDPNEDNRQRWSSKTDYILSNIASAVGLGNVWRFAFVAFKNGGGAFLIPYLIVLVFIGRPMYFLEMYMGQFSQKGPIEMWAVSPLFKGVGYITAFSNFLILTYYTTIQAQCMVFFFASFQRTLPWTQCNPNWNKGRTHVCLANFTINKNSTNKTTAELYYDEDAFPKVSNINHGLGAPDWRLSICLLASYFMILMTISKGVESSGKMAYFTGLFPYAVLSALLIRGATLKNAWVGIKYFLLPQWGKMLDPTVWYEAVGQCFYSVGIAGGSIVTFASYNPIKQDSYHDPTILCIADTFASILAGVATFGILGYFTGKKGVKIHDVTEGGPGLAFITYPEAIGTFPNDPFPQICALLFFLMLIALASGSSAAFTQSMVTCICDQYPRWNRQWVRMGVCLVCFLCGLLYVTKGGQQMIDVVDYFGGTFMLPVIAMAEVWVISFRYKLSNVITDVEFMTGRRLGWYWKLSFYVICPIGLLFLFITAMVTYQPMDIPKSATVCGWMLAVFGFLLIPGFAINEVVKREEVGLWNKIVAASAPTELWGPQSQKMRQRWLTFREERDKERDALKTWWQKIMY